MGCTFRRFGRLRRPFSGARFCVCWLTSAGRCKVGFRRGSPPRNGCRLAQRPQGVQPWRARWFEAKRRTRGKNQCRLCPNARKARQRPSLSQFSHCLRRVQRFKSTALRRSSSLSRYGNARIIPGVIKARPGPMMRSSTIEKPSQSLPIQPKSCASNRNSLTTCTGAPRRSQFFTVRTETPRKAAVFFGHWNPALARRQ